MNLPPIEEEGLGASTPPVMHVGDIQSPRLNSAGSLPALREPEASDLNRPSNLQIPAMENGGWEAVNSPTTRCVTPRPSPAFSGLGGIACVYPGIREYVRARIADEHTDSAPACPPISFYEIECMLDELQMCRLYWTIGGIASIQNMVLMAMNEARVLLEFPLPADAEMTASPLARWYIHLLRSHNRISAACLRRYWRREACWYAREVWRGGVETRLPPNLPTYLLRSRLPEREDFLLDLELFGNCQKPGWIEESLLGHYVSQAYDAELSGAIDDEMLMWLNREYSECSIQSGGRSVATESIWALINVSLLGVALGEIINWWFSGLTYDWLDVRAFASVFICILVMRSSKVPSYREFVRIRVACLITLGIIVALAMLCALGKAYSSNDAGDGPFNPFVIFDYLPILGPRDMDMMQLTLCAAILMWFGVIPPMWLLLIPGFILRAIASLHMCNPAGSNDPNISVLGPWQILLFVFPITMIGTMMGSLYDLRYILPCAYIVCFAWNHFGPAYSSDDAGDGPSPFDFGILLILSVMIYDACATLIRVYYTHHVQRVSLDPELLQALEETLNGLRTSLLDFELQAGSDTDEFAHTTSYADEDAFDREFRGIQFMCEQLDKYAHLLEARFPTFNLDATLRKIEVFGVFIRNWRNARTRGDFVCACISLSHGLFEGSLSVKMVNMVKSLFAGDVDSQVPLEGFGVQGGWEDCKERFRSWKDLLDSPFGIKLHEFFALCTYGGIIAALGFSVKTEAFKRYYKETKLHEKWSASIYLQLIDNAIFIVERVGDFLCTWEISSLLHSDDEARKLDAEFAFLKGNFGSYKSGGLERNVHVVEGVEKPVVTDVEYRNRVFQLLSTMRLKNLKFTTQWMKTPERVVFTRKLEELERMNAEVIAGMNSKVMREAPFAVTLSGYTGQAKSGIVTMLSKVFAKAYGLQYFDNLVVNINAKDKYQSEVKTSHMGIILDDFANTKKEFVKESPTDQIIDIVNNVRKYVLKADVGEKGMVQWNNLWLIATTNVPSLDVGSYSNEPAAVLRRFVYHISMRVREEYAKDTSRNDEIFMLDPEKMEGEVIRDAWLFDVRVTQVCTPVMSVNEESPGITPCRHFFKIATGETGPNMGPALLKDISIKELCYLLGHAARAHANSQRRFVDALTRLETEPMCECFNLQKFCDIHRDAVQAGDDKVHVATALQDYPKTLFVVGCFMWLWETMIVPGFWIAVAFARYIMLFLYTEKGWSISSERTFRYVLARQNYVFSYSTIAFCVISQMCVSAFVPVFFFFWTLRFRFTTTIAFSLLTAVIFSLAEWRLIVIDVSSKWSKITVHDVRKAINTKYLLGAAALGAILWFCTFSKDKAKDCLDVQGGFFSTPVPDTVKKPDIWVKSDLLQCLPLGTKARNMTMPDFQDMIGRSQVFVRARTGNGPARFTNGIFLKSNFLLIPYHLLLTKMGYADELEIHFAPLDKTGSHFRIKVGPEIVARVPNRDLAVVYTARGGPRKDLFEMGVFPEDIIHMPRLGISEIHRDKNGEVILHKYCASSAKYNDQVRPEIDLRGEFECYLYMRPSPTFEGLCGSTLCAKIGGGPCIVGFHQLGRTGAENGVACAISAPMLRDTVDKLKAKCPLVCETADVMPDLPFVPHSADMPIPLKISDTVDPKSVTNMLPPGSSIISLGRHNQARRSMRSQVELTPIAELVSEECGVPISHDKPILLGKLKGWYDNLVPCTGSYQFEWKFLSRAYLDLRDHILGAVRANKDRLGPIRPYTLKVATSGFPGARGVNPMKLNTSMGWPYLRPKKYFLFRGEPEEDYPDGPIEVPPEIMVDVERAREICASGARPGTVFTACQKDEPTKINKEKVRIFTSSNIILSILVRQYFLPIARIIIQYPVLFFMAVGMNCYGNDWVKLHEYLIQFGKDRLFAGDFEKYDKRFEYQLQILCWVILISMAEILGYSEEDLKIMRSLAEDIARSIWEFNGEFQLHETVNSSGHDLTVVINGLGNALQSMYCFYKGVPSDVTLSPPHINQTRVTFEKMMPDLDWSFLDELDKVPLCEQLNGRFTRYASLVTLGDDNVLAVSPSCDWFNHITMSKHLADIGLSYTTADKQVPTKPFEGIDGISFLKRRFEYHPDIDRVVAPIEEASIWKSLFCYKRDSPVVWELHCAEQIDSALREFCLFGEEVFEQRRRQLERVARRADILNYFPKNRLFTYRELVGWYNDIANE